MKFKVNNKYIVDAKSHDEAIKIIKKLQDRSIKDSAASDIVREIKSKYPNVQIQFSSGMDGDMHVTDLYFRKYPGEGATGFGNDPRTKEKDNWKKFLNYLYSKYTGKTSRIAVSADGFSIYEKIKKDSVKDEEVSLDYLIKDEIEAINGYKAMIAKTKNPKLLDVLSHILSEEVMHVEELRNAQSGNFEIVDSVNDSFYDSIKDVFTNEDAYSLMKKDPSIWCVCLFVKDKKGNIITSQSSYAFSATSFDDYQRKIKSFANGKSTNNFEFVTVYRNQM